MSQKFTKYDIAISFTEKDSKIAMLMAKALKRRGLCVYFYKDVNQFGKDLEHITSLVYGRKTNYGLVILSEEYSKRRWTRQEWKVLQKAKQNKKIKDVFIVRLDVNVTLPGLKRSNIHEMWKDNPRAITKYITEQMSYPSSRILKFLMIVTIIFLISILYHLFNK